MWERYSTLIDAGCGYVLAFQDDDFGARGFV